MMKAPLRPGTRPVGAAQQAVKDTSTDGPVVAATPGVLTYLPTLQTHFELDYDCTCYGTVCTEAALPTV